MQSGVMSAPIKLFSFYVQRWIKWSLKMSQITMYSTSVCPYCVSASKLLQQKGVEHINKISVDTSQVDLQAMIQRTGRRSVPQIFIGERHVGGFDDLVTLDRSGELDALLSTVS